MAQPYIGEIRMFGGNFAPVGWMFCDGTLLSISEYETLFNLIGTTYGGNGQDNFALPDLRGRFPVHQGGGHVLAETYGVEEVTLTQNQIPSHQHVALANSGAGTSASPSGGVWAGNSNTAISQFAAGTSTTVNMNSAMVGATGGSQPHSNMPPYTCISFIISLFGIFPSQS
jgi:microcystin-dependent protein